MKSNIKNTNAVIITLTTALILTSVLLAGCGPTEVELEQLDGECRCLSLRVLTETVAEAQKAGRPIPAEALNLGGLGMLEGYYIDDENADVVLVGRSSDRQLLHLDDLALALRILDGGQDPSCSLDPMKDGVLNMNKVMSEPVDISDEAQLADFVARLQEATGPQEVVVEGVPLNSRWAWVMIQADYEMKKIGQGYRAVQGVQSSLDMKLEKAMKQRARGKKPRSGGGMSRYWFHLAEDPRFYRSDDIVFLEDCEVIILTEAQAASADGQLSDSGGKDKAARAWAAQFDVDLVGGEVLECAQLQALFRLLAVAKVMDLDRALEKVDLDLSFFSDGYALKDNRDMPPSLPGLANAKVAQHEDEEAIYYEAGIVCGGVSMDAPVKKKNILSNEMTREVLTPVKEMAQRLRPLVGFWWSLTAAS
jgi:hypothetical protein